MYKTKDAAQQLPTCFTTHTVGCTQDITDIRQIVHCCSYSQPEGKYFTD